MSRVEGKAAVDYRINRLLGRQQAVARKARESVASGSHINRASDDAAALAISTRMAHELGAYGVAKTNAKEGQAYVNTKEGALGSLVEITLRMRELAVRAATDTITDADRTAMTEELNQLKASVDDSFEQTFNNIRLFSDATGGGVVSQDMVFAIGISGDASSRLRMAGDTLKFQWNNVKNNVQVASQGRARRMLTQVDSLTARLRNHRSYVGAISSRLERATDQIADTQENTGAAEGRIRDADFAQVTGRLVSSQIITSAATALISQANTTHTVMFGLLPS